MDATPQVRERPETSYAGIGFTVTMAAFPAAADSGFPEVLGGLGALGISPAGPPFIRYHVIDMDNEIEIEIGAPVPPDAPGQLPPGGRLRAGTLPGGRYAALVHTGPYDGLVAANGVLLDWIGAESLSPAVGPDGRWAGRVEYYLTDPSAEPDPAGWQTEIAILLA